MCLVALEHNWACGLCWCGSDWIVGWLFMFGLVFIGLLLGCLFVV